jgi:hypothetical protein
MRNMVEGVCGGGASVTADAPSTALRAVPLPRCAGQDTRSHRACHASHPAAAIDIFVRTPQSQSNGSRVKFRNVPAPNLKPICSSAF